MSRFDQIRFHGLLGFGHTKQGDNRRWRGEQVHYRGIAWQQKEQDRVKFKIGEDALQWNENICFLLLSFDSLDHGEH